MFLSCGVGEGSLESPGLQEIKPCVLNRFSRLCDPMHCSPPGSSVPGILQARTLEWVAKPSSRGSSWPRNWTHISYASSTSRWVLYHQHRLGSPYSDLFTWKKWKNNSIVDLNHKCYRSNKCFIFLFQKEKELSFVFLNCLKETIKLVHRLTHL